MKTTAQLCLIFALFILLGCTPGAAQPATQESAPAPQKIVLGLALSNLANPFFVSIQQGAAEAARRTGAELVVQDAADSSQTQADQIKAMIDQRVSALLVNPVDGDAVAASIEAANAAGIPVFTIDRSANGGEVVSHIASDNVAGGEMAGDYLAELLDETGNVVELQGIEGTSAAADRGAGFNQAVAQYPNIKIIAQERGNFNRADGKAVFAQILAGNPEIDGVFAHNDDMILGAIEAAQEANRAASIIFVGFDAVDDAVAAVENNQLAATIAQQPAEMGRLGVELAAQYLAGETVPGAMPVDLALVTK